MNYYIKSNFKSINNTDIYITIGDDRAVGSELIQLEMAGEEPIIIEQEGNLDDIYQPAYLTKAVMRFVVNDDDKLKKVMEWLSGIKFNEVPYVIYLNGLVQHIGFINPNIRQADYYEPVTELEIIGYDLLTALQYIKFNPEKENDTSTLLSFGGCLKRVNDYFKEKLVGSLGRYIPFWAKDKVVDLGSDIIETKFSKLVFQKDNNDGENTKDDGFASYLDILSEYAKLLSLTIIQTPANTVIANAHPYILFTDYNSDFGSNWKFDTYQIDNDGNVLTNEVTLPNRNEIINLSEKASRGTGDTITKVNNYTEAVIKTNQDSLLDDSGNPIDPYNLVLIDFDDLKEAKASYEGAPYIISKEVCYGTDLIEAFPEEPNKVRYNFRFGSKNWDDFSSIQQIEHITTEDGKDYVEDTDGNSYYPFKLSSAIAVITDSSKSNMTKNVSKACNNKVYISEDNHSEYEGTIKIGDKIGDGKSYDSYEYCYIGNLELPEDSKVIVRNELTDKGDIYAYYSENENNYFSFTDDGVDVDGNIAKYYNISDTYNDIFGKPTNLPNGILKLSDIYNNLKTTDSDSLIDWSNKMVVIANDYGKNGAGLMRFGISAENPDDRNCNPSFKDYIVLNCGIKNLAENNDTKANYSLYKYGGETLYILGTGNGKEDDAFYTSEDLFQDSTNDKVSSAEVKKVNSYRWSIFTAPLVNIKNNSFSTGIEVDTKKHNAFVLSMDVTYPNQKDIFNLPLNNINTFDPDKATDTTDTYGVYKAAFNQKKLNTVFLAIIKFDNTYFGNYSEEDLYNKNTFEFDENERDWYYSKDTVLYTPIFVETKDDEDDSFLNSKLSGRTVKLRNENGEFYGYYCKDKGLLIKYGQAVDYRYKGDGMEHKSYSDNNPNVTLNNELFDITFCRPLPTTKLNSVSSWDNGWRENADLLIPSKLFLSDMKLTLTGNIQDRDKDLAEENTLNQSASELKLVRTPNKVDKTVQSYKTEYLLRNSTQLHSFNNNTFKLKNGDYKKLYDGKEVDIIFNLPQQVVITSRDESTIISKFTNSSRGEYENRLFKIRYSNIESAYNDIVKERVFSKISTYVGNNTDTRELYIIIKEADWDNSKGASEYITFADSIVGYYGSNNLTNDYYDFINKSAIDESKIFYVRELPNDRFELIKPGSTPTNGVSFYDGFTELSSDKFRLWKIYQTYMNNSGLTSVKKTIDYKNNYQLSKYFWKYVMEDDIKYPETVTEEKILHKAGEEYIEITSYIENMPTSIVNNTPVGRYYKTGNSITTSIRALGNTVVTNPPTMLLITEGDNVKEGDYAIQTNNTEYAVDILTDYDPIRGTFKAGGYTIVMDKFEYYLLGSAKVYEYQDDKGNVIYKGSGDTTYGFGIFNKVSKNEDGSIRYISSCDLRVGYQNRPFTKFGVNYVVDTLKEDIVETITENVPASGSILRIINAKVDLANESIECDLALVKNCYRANMDLVAAGLAYYIPANKDYNLDGSINFGGSLTNYISKAIEENNNKNLLFDPNKALVTDDNGLIDTSRTTAKEISFVSGARRNIQQQIDELDRLTLEMGASSNYTGGDNIEITDDNVINCTLKNHLYTSYRDLGFTSAPTPRQFFDKMEAGTHAILNETQLAPVVNTDGKVIPNPYTSALIFIVKQSSTRGRATAYGQVPKRTAYDGVDGGNGGIIWHNEPFNDWVIEFSPLGQTSEEYWKPLSFVTTQFIQTGNAQLKVDDHNTEWWRCRNVASRAGIKADGWNQSANLTGGENNINNYHPAIAFRKSKDYGSNFKGDYNWSIGTWPSEDTKDTETRLHFIATNDPYDEPSSTGYYDYEDYWFDVYGRTKFRTTFGEYFKDCIVYTDGTGTLNCSTGLKKSNLVSTSGSGFNSTNRLVYADNNGKVNTVSMSTNQLVPTEGNYGATYTTMANVVVCDFHGCTVGQLQDSRISIFEDNVMNSAYCCCSTKEDGQGNSCWVKFEQNRFYSPAANSTRVWGQMTLILLGRKNL